MNNIRIENLPYFQQLINELVENYNRTINLVNNINNSLVMDEFWFKSVEALEALKHRNLEICNLLAQLVTR